MGMRSDTWQGMNWCRPSTRLAIYLRDGMACAWCGKGIEENIQLTLDHYLPLVRGGDSGPRNLVTSCRTCNCARGAKSAVAFARTFPDWETLLASVRAKRRRKLPRKQALGLLQSRGSVSLVCQVYTSNDCSF